MKKFSVDKIRKLKLFEKGDLFIYSVLFLLIAALFISFIIIPATAKSGNGFIVSKHNLTVLTVKDFSVTVEEDFNSLVKIDNLEDRLCVTVYTDTTKTGYNVITFFENGSVKITDSTCSHSKDCTFFPAIKNSGTIYCAPHDLKIELVDGDDFIPPTAGGGV